MKIDPVQRVTGTRVGHAHRAEARHEPREVEDGRDGHGLQRLLHPGPGGVLVAEEAAAGGEPQPVVEVVVGEQIEAPPVRVLVLDRGRRERDAALTEAHAGLTPVDRFPRQQEPWQRAPRDVEIDEPSGIGRVVGLLVPPPAADPDVEQTLGRERRDADTAADALGAVVVVEGVVGRDRFPAVGDPPGDVEPRRKGVRALEARHAGRAPELEDLRGRRGQEEVLVVTLEPEGHVEAPEGHHQTVADRDDARDVKPVKVDLGLGLLRPEALHADAGPGTAEVRVEAVAVTIPVTFHLDRGPGREPRGERLRDAERERVEPEVDASRVGERRRAPGELRHHRDVRVVARRAGEEPAEPQPRRLGCRQPEQLEGVLLVQGNLALAWCLAHDGRWRGRRSRGGRVRTGDGAGRPRVPTLLQPLEPLLKSFDALPDRLDLGVRRGGRLRRSGLHRQQCAHDRCQRYHAHDTPHADLPRCAGGLRVRSSTGSPLLWRARCADAVEKRTRGQEME